MDNTKFTKGKWSVSAEYHYYNGNKALEINYGEDGECVAEIVHDSYDAKLISKAPEMLEMLIELREIFDRYSVNPEQQFFKYKEPLEQLIKEATEIN